MNDLINPSSIPSRLRQGWLSLLTLLLVALLSVPAVLADDTGFYIETRNRSSGMMGSEPEENLTKTYLAHGKMKVVNEGPDATDMILDPVAGTITFVNQSYKQYYQINVKDMLAGMTEANRAQIQAMVGETKVKVEETGAKQRIGDWDCKEYRVTKTGMMEVTQEIWATEDLQIDVQAFTDMMSLSGTESLLGQSAASEAQRAEMAKIKGYPILTKAKMQMMGTTVETSSEVTLIRQEAIPAALFEIPEGFTPREIGVNPGTGSGGEG